MNVEQEIQNLKYELAKLEVKLQTHRNSNDHDQLYSGINSVARMQVQLDNIMRAATFDGGSGIVIGATGGKRYKITVSDSGELQINEYVRSVV